MDHLKKTKTGNAGKCFGFVKCLCRYKLRKGPEYIGFLCLITCYKNNLHCFYNLHETSGKQMSHQRTADIFQTAVATLCTLFTDLDIGI